MIRTLRTLSRSSALVLVLGSTRWAAAQVEVKTFDISGSGSCARMRMGDLNGDGRLDFLMVQPSDDNPSYVRMLTAYDGFTGERLWQIGTDNGLTGTDRDEPAQIYDIDNDGQSEVVAAMEGELRFYNGADGSLEKAFDLPAGDAHDAILFANFSQNPVAQDIVLKNRYSRAWVVDIDGEVLWTYQGITGHYAWPYDTDGDGRDELFIGYERLDYDGTPKYEAPFDSDHPDCIWLGDVDNNPGNGVEVVYGLAERPSLQAVNTQTGRTMWTNDSARESQQVIFGDFRPDLPGLEVYGMDRVNRTTQDALFVVSSSGETLWKETPDNSGFGTAIKLIHDWDGSGAAMCLAIKRGSGVRPELRDGKGEIVAHVGSDGENAVVADFAGDSKQEIVMYGRTTATVYAASELDYNQPPPNPGHPMPQVKGYYNYSRYGSGDTTAFDVAPSSAGTGGTGSGGGSAALGGTNSGGTGSGELGGAGATPSSGATGAIAGGGAAPGGTNSSGTGAVGVGPGGGGTAGFGTSAGAGGSGGGATAATGGISETLGGTGADGSGASNDDSGCTCTTVPAGHSLARGTWWLVLLALAVQSRRHRHGT